MTLNEWQNKYINKQSSGKAPSSTPTAKTSSKSKLEMWQEKYLPISKGIKSADEYKMPVLPETTAEQIKNSYAEGEKRSGRIESVFGAIGTGMASAYTNLIGWLKESDAYAAARDKADRAYTQRQDKEIMRGKSPTILSPEAQQQVYKVEHEKQKDTWSEYYKTADKYGKEAESYTTAAKEGLGKVGQALVDIGVAGGELLADAAVNLMLPGAGLASMAARVAGSTAREKRLEGADIATQSKAAVSSAAISVLTEKIFNAFGKVYGKGATDDIVETIVKKAGKTNAGRSVLRWTLEAAGEGAEEAIEDVFNAASEKLLKTGDGELKMGDVMYDALIGAVLGGMGASVQIVNGNYRIKNAEIEANDSRNINYDIVRKSAARYVASKTKNDPETNEIAKTILARAEEGEKLTENELIFLALNIDEETAAERLGVNALADEPQFDTAQEEITATEQTDEPMTLREAAPEEAQKEIVPTEEAQESLQLNDPLKQPEEDRPPLPLDDHEQFIKDRYAEAVKDGILTEANIKGMINELNSGTPVSELVARADKYVKEKQDERRNRNNGSLGRNTDDGTRVEGGAVRESAGRDKGEKRGADRAAKEDGGRAEKKNTRKVSSKSLGIENGTDNENITVVDKKSKIAEIISTISRADCTIVNGPLEIINDNGKKVRVSGVNTGNGKIVVRGDHRLYTAEQLLLHETAHGYETDDMTRDMRDAVIEAVGQEHLDELCIQYALKWSGLYNEEDVTEAAVKYENEVYADALAGISRPGTRGTKKLTEAVRRVFKKYTGLDIDLLLQEETGKTEEKPAKESKPETEAKPNAPPRYSTAEADDESHLNLIAVHGTTEAKLLKALKLEGLPGLSTAVINIDDGLANEGYGEISLVFDKDTIDPERKGNSVYGADIWSPTQSDAVLERQTNSDGIRKFESMISDMSSEIAGGAFSGSGNLGGVLYSGGDSTTKDYDDIVSVMAQQYEVKAAYLADQGVEVDAKYKPMEFYYLGNGALDYVLDAFEDETSFNGYSSELFDLAEHSLDRTMTDDEVSRVKDIVSGYLISTGIPEKTANMRASRFNQEKIFRLLKAAFEYDASGRPQKNEIDKAATREEIDKNIDNEKFEKWIRDRIDEAGVLTGEEGLYNKTDRITNNGRKSFKQTHMPVTAANIVKLMNKTEARGAGYFGHGAEGLQALTAEKYSSIDAIRKDKGRLRALPDEEFKTVKAETDAEIKALINEIAEYNGVSDYRIDSAFMDSARGARTANTIRKAYSDYGYNISGDLVTKSQQLFDEIAVIPSKYFEAKASRVVGFDEIKKAVIPDDASNELVDALKEKGIPYVFYEAGNNSDRLHTIQKMDDIRFSADDEAYMDAIEAGDMVTAQAMVDEAAKAAGYSVPLWHGTPNGTFNVFRDWSYFTADKSYADVYQNQGASENYKKTANAPRTYAVYAKLDNVFDTRNKKEKHIFENEFYRKWGNGAPLSERGLPDWTDGDDFIEFFEENGYEYDALLLDEGGTGGYGETVNDRGISYVIKNSAQLKSADPITYDDNGNIIPLSERFNPYNDDIRYSADDATMSEEEAQQIKDFRKIVRGESLKKLNERALRLEGIIRGYEKTEKLTDYQMQELERTREKLNSVNAEIERKTKKAEEQKEIRKAASETAQEAANELSTRWTARESRENLKKSVYEIFGIESGRKDVGATVDAFADKFIEQGSIKYEDIDRLETKLMQLGAIRVESANEYAREVRQRMTNGFISVPQYVVDEFGDDWDAFRKRAWGNKIYLSIESRHPGIDVWTNDLAESFGAGVFDDSLDLKTQLENIVNLAEDGKDENLTVYQMAEHMRKTEGRDTADAYLDDIHNQLINRLKTFAETAKIEMDIKKRSAYQKVREEEIRKAKAERAADERARREKEQALLKQLQWLKRNQNFMGNDLKEDAKKLLADIDTIAVHAANEMNYSNKYNATWKDLADMYAEWKKDPNFLPNKELETMIERINGKHIEDMSIVDIENIYKAAVALRTAYYNRKNVIGDALGREFSEMYENAVEEVNEAKKPKKTVGKIPRLLGNVLNPINRIERMFGWRKDSSGYQIFGKGLEQGEIAMRRYTEQANQMLDGFLEDNKEWVKKADGQGKDAIWYELEVPELLEYHMGDKPIFGKTVKVYMTPMQKVHLYLESKNYQNLRHMVGGRTFVNKELYEKGERDEAFKQGITISLAPETVKNIVSDLTPQEMALANILERYYNEYAKTEINRVSNILYGFDKAITDNYAPIYTNKNYTISEPGVFNDGTAEGVANMKTRVEGSKNPSYNMSAIEAFRKHSSMTGKFVGLAIPVQNAKTLLNYRGNGTTMMEEITHNWSGDELRGLEQYMTDLQGSNYLFESELQKGLGKLTSNYLGGVFGANVGTAMKVFASIPTAATSLDFRYFPSVKQLMSVDPAQIRQYTSEYDVRARGLSRPELAAIAMKDSRYTDWVNDKKWRQYVLGGGMLQGADLINARIMWPWAENKVKAENPELSGEDFYKKVAEVYNDAIVNTQSMYDVSHRSEIMRDRNDVVKSFTMFHTDSMQVLNILRRRAGEVERAREELENAPTEEEKKAAGAALDKASKLMATAIVAEIATETIVTIVDVLRNLIRRRDDDYKNEDGEITFGSFSEEYLLQLLENASGLLMADDVVETIASLIRTGGIRFGDHSIIALDAYNDILENAAGGVTAIWNALAGLAAVIKDDGDVWEYLKDNSDFRGAIKDSAASFAQMFVGVPVKNIERVITNTIGVFFPQFKIAYDAIWEDTKKSDLKDSPDLAASVKKLYKSRTSISNEAADELARLYEAGYTEAIIADSTGEFTVNDEDVKLGKSQFQQYNQTIGSALDHIDEIISSDIYKNASDEEKAKMLSRLNSYARDKAKEEVTDFEAGGFTDSVDEWLAEGMSWAQIMSGDTKANDKAAKFIDNGVSSEKVWEILDALDELQPEEEGKNISTRQKVRAIGYLPISESEKEAAMKVVTSEKSYERYMLARDNGVSSADYADFLDILNRVDVNGGDPSKDDFEEAVNRADLDRSAAAAIWKTYFTKASPWG